MDLNQPSPPDPWPFRRVMGASLLLISIALTFWLLYRFYQIVFLLFIAIVIATWLKPIVNWLYARGLPRITAVILIYLVILALILGFILVVFPMVVEQGSTIASAIPEYYQGLRNWLSSSSNLLLIRLNTLLPPTISGLQSTQQNTQQMLATAEQAFGYLSLAGKSIFLAIVTLLLAFYWTLDGPRMTKSLLLLISQDKRENISEMISAIETKISSFLAGQGLLCLFIGIMAMIAYLLIGLPNALLLALLAGIFEAVPMVGPLLGAIPASLIALSIGSSKLIWVIVATIVIQQVENSLLVPRVMRKAVGVNPYVSLLSLFAFSSLFGIAGALMAIPIAAIIQLLLDRYVFNPETVTAEDTIGRDLTSRLRYKAQDLTQDLRKHTRYKKGISNLRIKQTDHLLEEIETITTDLDSLLSQVNDPGTQ